MIKISTHTPHAGRDPIHSTRCHDVVDFNSHAPCGARPEESSVISDLSRFQLTRPMRGATCTIDHSGSPSAFQLTRPMRGATMLTHSVKYGVVISTHTPHAGRDLALVGDPRLRNRFQLTRPMRGATFYKINFNFMPLHFNSHAPCGARLSWRG